MMLEPVLVKKEKILLMGLSFFGDPFSNYAGWIEENEIGRLWKRIAVYFGKELLSRPFPENHLIGYEVHIEHEETPEKGHFEVFAGIEIKDWQSVPYNMQIKVLPATQYAVFTLKGKEITSDWELNIGAWLKERGYQKAFKYDFQYFDSRFKGLDRIEASIIDVYIPIKPAAVS